ncbi:MAG: MoxR family ATPase [Candidatus Bathyarchaeia archaeon]
MNVTSVSETCKQIHRELGNVIVGKDLVLRKILLGMLTNSHILIEDFPGLAKTLIAKSLAATIRCSFTRVQFTPDLLPADITGTYVYNQKTGDFELRKGPIFTNILLADEINRSPPKTQAALLEAMQERQVTLDGKSQRIASPFMVVATENPIEFEGVYQLPEAQLDRFIMRLGVGYPERSEEFQILKGRMTRRQDEFVIEPVASPETIIEMQTAVEDVHVDDDVLSYMVDIARETRTQPQVEVGVSPRGTLALLKLSRANAAFDGRDYVIPDDAKSIAIEALSHRIIPKAESWVRGFDSAAIVAEVLRKVPVPRVE